MGTIKVLKNNEDGFTLIELILVIAVIGIITTFLGTPLINGFNFFKQDLNHVNIQEDLRFTSTMIITYTEYAKSISLIDSEPASFASNEICIMLDQSNDTVKYLDSSGEKRWTESTITDLAFNLIKKDNQQNVLQFSIAGNKDGEAYNLDSQVLLNNIAGETEITSDYIGILITE
ncbi:MAG: type II secretion system protein [Halanaerobiales bacterium]|nr:type II secretion system protein [Halanaerobiales bacterium]